jgi:hypothetical protein
MDEVDWPVHHAKAVVAGVRQLTNCTAAELRMAVTGFGLYDLERYWSSLPARFGAIAIYLRNETWLDEPVALGGRRSRGASWIVFPNRADREKWLTAPLESPEARGLDPRGPRTPGPWLRFAVFRRDSYTCQYCGRRAPEVVLHADHVLAWARGGRTELPNLRTACRVCNAGKSAGDARLIWNTAVGGFMRPPGRGHVGRQDLSVPGPAGQGRFRTLRRPECPAPLVRSR